MMNEQQGLSQGTMETALIDRTEDVLAGMLHVATADKGKIESLPVWVQEIRNALNDTIYGKSMTAFDDGESDPYSLGLAIGLSKRSSEITAQYLERLETLGRRIKIPDHLLERLEKIGEKFFDALFPEKDIEALHVLSNGYLSQAYNNWESARAHKFFNGLTRGLALIKDEDDNWYHWRANTEIHIHMLVYWRVIEDHIHTIPALHSWLLKTMPKHEIGELKRVEKLCSRIKLSLAKPGRPVTKAKKKLRKKTPTKKK